MSDKEKPTTTPDYSDILNNLKVAPANPQISPNKAHTLPTDGLPAKFVKYCQHVAERRNVPNEITLLSALTVAGAAIGAHVQSNIAGYRNRAGLWTMIIAPSASGKSQPLRDIMQPIYDIDKQLLANYAKELEAWRTTNAKSNNPAPKPNKTQIICSASTDAARVEFCCDNPRGGIIYRDELRAFFKSLSGKFNERAVENMLEIDGFNPVKLHTRGDDVIKSASCSFLPILGGIQNEILRDTVKTEFIYNGLLQRFVVAIFDAPGFPEIGAGIEPTQEVFWRNTVQSLRALGNIVWEYRPSIEAQITYESEYKKLIGSFVPDPNEDEQHNGYKRMAFAKTLYTIHRLALIAHNLRDCLNFID